MSNRSDAFDSGMSSLNSAGMLQAGLLALKQKDYRKAIEQLEAVCQASPPRSSLLKAEMGLVKAYVRTRQPQRAIKLCRMLCRSSNSQVQQWATQTLTDLEHRYGITSPSGTADRSDETGFVPMDPDPDDTGFMPSVLRTTSLESPEIKHSSPVQEAGQTPIAPSPEPAPRLSLPSTETILTSRGSQRLHQASSLGKVDRSSYWALQAGTIVLLVWWICALINFGRDRFNELLLSVRWGSFSLNQWVLLFDPFWSVVLGLTGLFLASPWILDAVLRTCYRMEDLRQADLESFSPEGLRLLKQATGSLPLPTLKRLPIAVPLCFSYGYLPRNARIVVSQGLLEQLEAEEIAALLVAEWSHIAQREFGILSLMAIVTQIPYRVYWTAARWGNQQSNSLLQGVAIAVSCLAYALYWLLRLPALLLSRIRLYFSDRAATELTGNPNGLARALLKLTIGTAAALSQQGSTPPLVESLEMLMPVGYRQSLTLGSFYRHQPTPDLLEWDRRPFCRPALNALNPHPLLGDRLSRLSDYARHWKLEPQIRWQPQPRLARSARSARLYFAPVLGVLGGLLLAAILWAIGLVAKQLGWLEIDWMWADESVIVGLALLGFSGGTFLRINAFFPDIQRMALRTEPLLMDWLTDPTALPIDFHPVRLQGHLYGRRGILNRLHQDLFLHIGEPAGEPIGEPIGEPVNRGMIRLHYTTPLGWLTDVLLQVVRPELWLTPPSQSATPQKVTVVGWFRRGAVPWIDVETIQSPRGTIAQSAHPAWSTLVGTIAALAGAYVIFTGGS